MSWSWIVPLIFTIGLLVWTAWRYHVMKEAGVCTAAEALKADITADGLAEAAVILFLLWRFTGFALAAWLLWALFSRALQCGI